MKTYFKTCLLSLALIGFVSCNAKNKKQTVALNDTQIVHHEPSKTQIKVALLLDTSNSMDGLIDQAKLNKF